MRVKWRECEEGMEWELGLVYKMKKDNFLFLKNKEKKREKLSQSD